MGASHEVHVTILDQVEEVSHLRHVARGRLDGHTLAEGLGALLVDAREPDR